MAVVTPGCCTTDPAALDLPDPNDRREALACIAAKAQEDGDHVLGAAAIAAAIRFSDPTAEPDPALRAAAIRVLGFLQVRTATPLLVRRLVAGADADPIPATRAAAATALGGMKGDVSARALIDALRDRSREVRLAAARELRGASSPEVDEALVSLLRDEAPEVRLVAHRSLVLRNDKKDLGLDPDTWSTFLGKRPARGPGPTGPALPLPTLEDVPELEGPELVGPDEGPIDVTPPLKDERPLLPPGLDPNPESPPTGTIPRPRREDPGEGDPR